MLVIMHSLYILYKQCHCRYSWQLRYIHSEVFKKTPAVVESRLHVGKLRKAAPYISLRSCNGLSEDCTVTVVTADHVGYINSFMTSLTNIHLHFYPILKLWEGQGKRHDSYESKDCSKPAYDVW